MKSRHQTLRISAKTATVLLLAAAVCGVAACGADDESTGGGQPAAAQSGTSRASATSSPSPDAPDDGKLTSTTGEVVTDFGDKVERKASVEAVTELQRAFHAGRMSAACRRIHSFLLEQFHPAGTKPQTPCPQKLEAYASVLAQRGAEVRRLRLLWVRAYVGNISGVWVADDRGRAHRIALRWEDGSWKLEIVADNSWKALNARLTGVGSYGR